MPAFWTDLRHALRSLLRSPGLTAVAVASLALGIGANVTIYSVVREMILDDLSARRPDRLVRIEGQVAYDRYRALQQAAVFQDLACDTGLGNMTWSNGAHGEIVWRMNTSANFFDVLGVDASAGRLYSRADEGHPMAVVSYGFWRNRLHADHRAVGRTLELDGKPYTVLGVLPRDYRSVMRHAISPELYLIAPTAPRTCHPFGRLNDRLTRSATQQALITAARTIGGEDFARQLALRPMSGLAVNATGAGDDRRYFLFFLMLYGTAATLAIVACFNVAGLLLARGVTRRRELAVCKALGANRYQIARRLLVEGLVLVSLGAAAGLVVDTFLRDRLSYIRWPSAYNLPFEFHFENDRGLFLYAVAIAVAALLLTSLLPALRGANADLSIAMKQSESAFSVRRWSLTNSFVALQVALSMVLLILGVLFWRSFLQVATLDPGFDVGHTLIVQVHPSPGHILHGEPGWTWRDGIVSRLRQIPGVLGITSIGMLPLAGELPREIVRRSGEPFAAAEAYTLGAGEQFCKVLGIPLLRGRDFELADRTRRPVPVLVNQTLARRLFGNADPLGAQLALANDSGYTVEIVGVTGDTKMRTLGEPNVPIFFTPYADAQLIVRVAGRPEHWIAPMTDTLDSVEFAAALSIRPLSDAASGAIFPMRVAAAFIGVLSAIAFLLVLTGLYSSVSYATRRRTREMAIRSAIGATRAAILWTAVRDGVTVLACGIAAGVPLAIAAIRPLTDILPDGLNPWHPAAFALVSLGLLTAGAAAAWIPARAAASVDPALALRQE